MADRIDPAPRTPRIESEHNYVGGLPMHPVLIREENIPWMPAAEKDEPDPFPSSGKRWPSYL